MDQNKLLHREEKNAYLRSQVKRLKREDKEAYFSLFDCKQDKGGVMVIYISSITSHLRPEEINFWDISNQ